MTERELRRLSRKDLLEMMIEQKKELEALKLELEEARKALQNREIMLNEAGLHRDWPLCRSTEFSRPRRRPASNI